MGDVIWTVSTAQDTDGPTGHFRRIEKPQYMESKEVLSRVGAFLAGLKEITGPSLKEMDISIPNSHRKAVEAQGCDLAPRREAWGKQY